MRRHPFVALLLGALLCTACFPDRRPLPRGLILISLDTLRADRLGLDGYERDTSPFLDALAQRSVVFERAISQAPWTAPAHAAMLMSMYPSVLGLGAYPRAGVVPEHALSLAEQLRKAGFRTHAETAGGFLSARLGFAQGFERYEDRPRSFGQSIDRGLAWLSELAPDERFFLFLHTYDIHRYEPPESARRELVDAERPPAELASAHAEALRGGAQGLAELMQNPVYRAQIEGLGPQSKRYLSQLYDASVRAADAQIQALHDALAKAGLLDETLLVVTSDHGEELFEHGRTGHGFTLFEENLRVPLLLAHRSLPAARIAQPVALLDLAPTLTELLGVSAPKLWQGRSLVPLLAGGAASRRVFADSAHRPLRAVRDQEFKLIRSDRGAVQLFDLRSDPAELRDLAGKGAAPEQALRAALEDWQRDNALRRLESAGEPELDEGLIEQLEALGYMDPPAREQPPP